MSNGPVPKSKAFDMTQIKLIISLLSQSLHFARLKAIIHSPSTYTQKNDFFSDAWRHQIRASCARIRASYRHAEDKSYKDQY